jgi:Flp pilus assembly protein TadG
MDPHGGERDRGSLAIEYVLVAPLFLLVFALIFAYARVTTLNSELDSATRDAARLVTQLPDLSPGNVQARASDAVRQDIGSGSGGCNSGNVVVTVTSNDPDAQTYAPGDTITVRASCGYSLSDLGLPVGGVGDLTARSQFSSVIDPNRSVQ